MPHLSDGTTYARVNPIPAPLDTRLHEKELQRVLRGIECALKNEFVRRAQHLIQAGRLEPIFLFETNTGKVFFIGGKGFLTRDPGVGEIREMVDLRSLARCCCASGISGLKERMVQCAHDYVQMVE